MRHIKTTYVKKDNRRLYDIGCRIIEKDTGNTGIITEIAINTDMARQYWIKWDDSNMTTRINSNKIKINHTI